MGKQLVTRPSRKDSENTRLPKQRNYGVRKTVGQRLNNYGMSSVAGHFPRKGVGQRHCLPRIKGQTFEKKQNRVSLREHNEPGHGPVAVIKIWQSFWGLLGFGKMGTTKRQEQRINSGCEKKSGEKTRGPDDSLGENVARGKPITPSLPKETPVRTYGTQKPKKA